MCSLVPSGGVQEHSGFNPAQSQHSALDLDEFDEEPSLMSASRVPSDASLNDNSLSRSLVGDLPDAAVDPSSLLSMDHLLGIAQGLASPQNAIQTAAVKDAFTTLNTFMGSSSTMNPPAYSRRASTSGHSFPHVFAHPSLPAFPAEDPLPRLDASTGKRPLSHISTDPSPLNFPVEVPPPLPGPYPASISSHSSLAYSRPSQKSGLRGGSKVFSGSSSRGVSLG